MRWYHKVCCGVFSAVAMAGCGAHVAQEKPVAVAPVLTPAQMRFDEAQALAAKESWAEAAALFAQASASDPHMAQAVFNEAVCREHMGALKEALQLYTTYSALEPQDMDALRARVRLQQALGLFAEALALLESVPADVRAADAALNFAYIDVLRSTRAWDKALDVARGLLMRDQKDVEAMKALALVYADKGDLQLASTYFANALKLAPKDADIAVNMGLIAHRKGDVAGALRAFEEALVLNPSHAAAYANKGALALAYRDYTKARNDYEKALSLGKVDCHTVSALGYALEGLKESKQALEQLEKAYQMCKMDTELLFAMGSVCMQQLRDSACALKHFEAYTVQTPALQKEHRVFQFIESLKASQPAGGAAPAAPAAQPNTTPAG
jgi:tetratricopeptide (TPR) repeat protein